jgi:hypothetical protein
MLAVDCHMTLEVIAITRGCSTNCACRIGASQSYFRKQLTHHCSRRDLRRIDSAYLPLYDPVAATLTIDALSE